jgi:hypothetical protein
MKEAIYFLSDIELGGGDLMDDFSDDDIFADFINKISLESVGSKVTLVLNGDIFDFLKMKYKEDYPRYIKENVSLWKMEKIMENHPIFFKALRGFMQNPFHNVHFVIGNHDADLAWSSIQQRIKIEMGNHERITFDYCFDKGDLHAQHGHLWDTFYTINKKKPIVKYKGEKILDLPWGTYAFFTHLKEIKKKYPKEEQLYPKPLLLKTHPDFNKEVKKAVYGLVKDMLFINPLFKFHDPTAKIPYIKLIKHTWRYGLEFADDEKFINFMIENAKKENPHKKVIVLGHSHIPKIVDDGKRKIFVTDTWRDEFDMTKNNKKKDKTYVRAKIYGDELGDVNFITF